MMYLQLHLIRRDTRMAQLATQWLGSKGEDEIRALRMLNSLTSLEQSLTTQPLSKRLCAGLKADRQIEQFLFDSIARQVRLMQIYEENKDAPALQLGIRELAAGKSESPHRRFTWVKEQKELFECSWSLVPLVN